MNNAKEWLAHEDVAVVAEGVAMVLEQVQQAVAGSHPAASDTKSPHGGGKNPTHAPRPDTPSEHVCALASELALFVGSYSNSAKVDISFPALCSVIIQLNRAFASSAPDTQAQENAPSALILNIMPMDTCLDLLMTVVDQQSQHASIISSHLASSSNFYTLTYLLTARALATHWSCLHGPNFNEVHASEKRQVQYALCAALVDAFLTHVSARALRSISLGADRKGEIALDRVRLDSVLQLLLKVTLVPGQNHAVADVAKLPLITRILSRVVHLAHTFDGSDGSNGGEISSRASCSHYAQLLLVFCSHVPKHTPLSSSLLSHLATLVRAASPTSSNHTLACVAPLAATIARVHSSSLPGLFRVCSILVNKLTSRNDASSSESSESLLSAQAVGELLSATLCGLGKTQTAPLAAALTVSLQFLLRTASSQKCREKAPEPTPSALISSYHDLAGRVLVYVAGGVIDTQEEHVLTEAVRRQASHQKKLQADSHQQLSSENQKAAQSDRKKHQTVAYAALPEDMLLLLTILYATKTMGSLLPPTAPAATSTNASSDPLKYLRGHFLTFLLTLLTEAPATTAGSVLVHKTLISLFEASSSSQALVVSLLHRFTDRHLQFRPSLHRVVITPLVSKGICTISVPLAIALAHSVLKLSASVHRPRLETLLPAAYALLKSSEPSIRGMGLRAIANLCKYDSLSTQSTIDALAPWLAETSDDSVVTAATCCLHGANTHPIDDSYFDLFLDEEGAVAEARSSKAASKLGGQSSARSAILLKASSDDFDTGRAGRHAALRYLWSKTRSDDDRVRASAFRNLLAFHPVAIIPGIAVHVTTTSPAGNQVHEDSTHPNASSNKKNSVSLPVSTKTVPANSTLAFSPLDRRHIAVVIAAARDPSHPESAAEAQQLLKRCAWLEAKLLPRSVVTQWLRGISASSATFSPEVMLASNAVEQTSDKSVRSQAIADDVQQTLASLALADSRTQVRHVCLFGLLASSYGQTLRASQDELLAHLRNSLCSIKVDSASAGTDADLLALLSAWNTFSEDLVTSLDDATELLLLDTASPLLADERHQRARRQLCDAVLATAATCVRTQPNVHVMANVLCLLAGLFHQQLLEETDAVAIIDAVFVPLTRDLSFVEEVGELQSRAGTKPAERVPHSAIAQIATVLTTSQEKSPLRLICGLCLPLYAHVSEGKRLAVLPLCQSCEGLFIKLAWVLEVNQLCHGKGDKLRKNMQRGRKASCNPRDHDDSRPARTQGSTAESGTSSALLSKEQLIRNLQALLHIDTTAASPGDVGPHFDSLVAASVVSTLLSMPAPSSSSTLPTCVNKAKESKGSPIAPVQRARALALFLEVTAAIKGIEGLKSALDDVATALAQSNQRETIGSDTTTATSSSGGRAAHRRDQGFRNMQELLTAVTAAVRTLITATPSSVARELGVLITTSHNAEEHTVSEKLGITLASIMGLCGSRALFPIRTAFASPRPSAVGERSASAIVHCFPTSAGPDAALPSRADIVSGIAHFAQQLSRAFLSLSQARQRDEALNSQSEEIWHSIPPLAMLYLCRWLPEDASSSLVGGSAKATKLSAPLLLTMITAASNEEETRSSGGQLPGPQVLSLQSILAMYPARQPEQPEQPS